jgi:hypothetical protein
MSEFMFAISNRANYQALGMKLKQLGVNFQSNGIKDVVGYKIPSATPAVFADIIAHLRPEKKLRAYPFFLNQDYIQTRSDNEDIKRKTAQLANASTMTLNKIKQASMQSKKDKTAMDLITTTVNNDKIIYAYLKSKRIKFSRYVGMAGIIIEFDQDEVGGIESSYFVKSALYAAANQQAETSETDFENSTDIVAIIAAFTLLYEHTIDLSKERFPPPCMPVSGMGTKQLDQAVIDSMSRTSAIGKIFGSGGNSVRPFGS